MSLASKNEIIFCIDCRASAEQCFCVCPYCGEQKNDCFCYIMDDIAEDLKNSIKNNPKFSSSKSIFQNTRDDDWWRLEKWQFGRRKFS